MSGTVGAVHPTATLGRGLDSSGRRHRRAVQKGRALVETCMLPVHPPPSAGGGRTPVRLPSLEATAVGPRRRSSMALLSHSEPSLLVPDENVLFNRFSSHRRLRVPPKRTPPPPPPFSKSSVRLSCKTSPPVTSLPRQQQNRQQVQSCSRPAYIHFSQAIQLGPKPRPVRNGFHPPSLSPEMVHSDVSVRQYHNALFQGEPLSLVGRPCLLSSGCPPLAAAAAAAADSPARTQLHVFLPTEAEGEEEGSESVDEGFMDEMDSKITSLKLQHRAPKTPVMPPML